MTRPTISVLNTMTSTNTNLPKGAWGNPTPLKDVIKAKEDAEVKAKEASNERPKTLVKLPPLPMAHVVKKSWADICDEEEELLTHR
jgi:hypothetical protein